MPSPQSGTQSLIEAATAGDDLGMQYAMRMIVAQQIADGCPARELASLTKRLKEINTEIKELEALKSEEDGNDADPPPEAWDPEAI